MAQLFGVTPMAHRSRDRRQHWTINLAPYFSVHPQLKHLTTIPIPQNGRVRMVYISALAASVSMPMGTFTLGHTAGRAEHKNTVLFADWSGEMAANVSEPGADR